MDINDVTKYGILFIIIAVVLGTSAIMLSSISNNLATPTAFTMSNYTITAGAGDTFNFNQTFKACSFSSITMANRSSSIAINSGNFSTVATTERGCQIIFSDSMSANYEGILVYFNSTNSYLLDTDASKNLDNGSKAIENLTAYLPTMALLVIVAIIIGVVFAFYKWS